MTKVSFCGISGSGMSALAQILKLQGNEVYGSDRSFDQGKDAQNKQALEDIGIIIKPQDGSAVTDDLDTLYVSTAVEDTIPDVKEALQKNIPIKKRSDLLAEIFHQYPYNIAVGGTSGKTTTTAMIGYVLDTLGKNPCVINGGFAENQVPDTAEMVLNFRYVADEDYQKILDFVKRIANLQQYLQDLCTVVHMKNTLFNEQKLVFSTP